MQREKGSHRQLARDGWQPVTFAYHDGDELGPRILAKLGKDTGLQPDDL